MDIYHVILSCLLALVSFLAVYIFNQFSDRIKSVEKEQANTHLLVVGQYITRGEFESKITALFTKLDRIEEKIDACRMSNQEHSC